MRQGQKIGRLRMAVALVTAIVGAAAPRAQAEVPAVGIVVGPDNVDRYLEVLSPGLEWLIRKGMTPTVAEYRRYEWPPKYREATEKYSAQVRLSADRRDLEGYVAGSPFPTIDANDPDAALKWMWNQEYKPVYTENTGCGWHFELVNHRGERERFFGSNFFRRMRWNGRVKDEPIPSIPHEPALSYTEQWGPLHDPPDLRGAGILNFRYLGADVPDDSYLYLPELRKVRRLSIANRSDAFWGTDIDIDHVLGWNSKIPFWEFKYLGEKKLLVGFHSGGYGQREALCAEPDGLAGTKTFGFCTPHELRDTVVIEGTPTGFNQYAFQKRIIYIDKEAYYVQINEGYDQGGQLWRTWYHIADVGLSPHDVIRKPDGSSALAGKSSVEDAPKYDDYERVFYTKGVVFDPQLEHASRWDCADSFLHPKLGVKNQYVDEAKDYNQPDTFTINYLIRSAGF